MTQDAPKTLPLEGVVTAKSQRDGVPTGVKLDVDPERWYNYSKPEWRDGQWYEPSQGERVRLHVAQGKWVKSIERLGGTSAQTAYENGQVPTAGRDLSIMRQVSIKAATEAVVARINRGVYPDEADASINDAIAYDIVAIAAVLERAMVREDVSFE